MDPANAAANNGSISGRITFVNGNPIEDVNVYLNSNGNFPQAIGSVVDSTTTDENGNYSFANLPMGSDYFVSAKSDGCIRDGIRPSDINRIQEHLLFSNRFNSPFEFIVSDVNDDGDVSIFDMVFISRLLLQLIEEFPSRDPYLFIRSDMVFFEDNPLDTQWERDALIFEVSSLSGPALVPDFIAYKIGDTTLSADGSDDSCE